MNVGLKFESEHTLNKTNSFPSHHCCVYLTYMLSWFIAPLVYGKLKCCQHFLPSVKYFCGWLLTRGSLAQCKMASSFLEDSRTEDRPTYGEHGSKSWCRPSTRRALFHIGHIDRDVARARCVKRYIRGLKIFINLLLNVSKHKHIRRMYLL